ncbi:glutathione S-transferase-like protein ustS [Penicillium argentinense]|uniref:Glutathione S-transferase-like protein ustS n=1 Tax=Penicillium argentinense TaxID=1131581 RepID=A0A9W9EI80_9EURO|nr:glutathione S-transferase-like protein ustS [Penicillium argentinense]KAJ5082278.1 glutathione S-transferase-like protein ustS [Penicillium argentinense]
MSSTSTSPRPLVFYDILMGKGYSGPNPWKTRAALNFKHLPYTTTWVPLPEIAKVRKGLGVPACRKFADGSDFYTLPIIEDPNTNSRLGDSFDIVSYLQKQYPDAGDGDLLPAQTLDFTFSQDGILIPLSEQGGVNSMTFTAHVVLCAQGTRFDPATAEATKAEFARRAGMSSWDDFTVPAEVRVKTLESFEKALGELGKLFLKDPSGPFVLGPRASYADIIVGAWLNLMRATLPDDEWQQVRSWHGGIFGQLYDGLQKYAEIK